MHRFSGLFLIVLLAALAACVPAGGESAADPASPDATLQPTRPEATPPNAELVPTAAPLEEMPMVPADDPLVLSAVDDLATRLGVRSSEITVIRAEPVIWSDGSLGCAQPDVMYTQALIDGMFIQLSAGDVMYNYHSGGSQKPFLCEGSVPVAPGQLPPGAVSSGNS